MNQPPTQPAESGQSFPCSNCGAKLQYDAGSQAMKCPYCGQQQAIPQQTQQQNPMGPPTVREIPIEEGLTKAARGYGTPVSTVSCRDCGATVNVSPGENTAKCAFCGSQQVLAQEAAGNPISPESIVPFKVDKAAANKKFEEWLGDLWFRPNDLKQMAKLQEMGGVYIPFWTFDAWVRSDWTADAGYYYYETEYYTDSEGNQQTRQVQRTRWEFASGWRQDFFDDTLVCASKGLPEELVEKFKSFNTQQLTPYKPEFLAGWRAESYAIDLMPAWSKGQESMSKEQESRCGRDVPGDTHRNLNVNNQFSHVTFKHVLLPIWIAAYRYNGKPYQFLVNGQTGEVVGKAPWSFWKIFFFVLACVAVISAGVALYLHYAEDRHPKPTPTRSTPGQPAARPMQPMQPAQPGQGTQPLPMQPGKVPSKK